MASTCILLVLPVAWLMAQDAINPGSVRIEQGLIPSVRGSDTSVIVFKGVPYVFSNLDRSLRPWTAADRVIARTMSDYWINFITKGDPNGERSPEWPTFRAKPEEVMELGETMAPRPLVRSDRFELHKKISFQTGH